MANATATEPTQSPLDGIVPESLAAAITELAEKAQAYGKEWQERSTALTNDILGKVHDAVEPVVARFGVELPTFEVPAFEIPSFDLFRKPSAS